MSQYADEAGFSTASSADPEIGLIFVLHVHCVGQAFEKPEMADVGKKISFW